VGGATGFLTARLQRQAQKEQLGLEEHRQATDEQHRAQERRDQLCEQRRLLYLRYLGAFDALHTRLNGPEIPKEELFDIWSTMIRVDNEIELMGSEAVKTASYPAANYFARLVGELDTIIKDPSRDWANEAPRLRRPDAMGQEMLDVRKELVTKMRLDLLDE